MRKLQPSPVSSAADEAMVCEIPDVTPYAVDYPDFLARADLLAASGMTVLISDFFDTTTWQPMSAV